MLDIDTEQRVQRIADIGRRAGDNPSPGVEHLVDLHRNDGAEDVALVLVVIVDRADRHFGLRRDRLDLGALVADLAEKCRRRLDDAAVPVRLLPCSQTAHIGYLPQKQN